LGAAIGTDDVEGAAEGTTAEATTEDVALAGGEAGEVGEGVSVGIVTVALTDGKLQASITINAMDKIMRRRFFILPPFRLTAS